MERLHKKKHHKKGKRKVPSNDSSNDSKHQVKKITKVKVFSFPKELSQKRISLHSSSHIPINIGEFDEMINIKTFKETKEDNYFEITSKNREEIKKIDVEIDREYNNKKNILNFLKEIEDNKNNEIEKCLRRIKEIYEEENHMIQLKNKINDLKIKFQESEKDKNIQQQILEQRENVPNNDIISKKREIEFEENNLTNKQQEIIELNKKIPELKDIISKYEEELNQEKNICFELTQKKNELKEQYLKINKIAIKDNKFCHDNFFALLTLFPYYKNVSFISDENILNGDLQNREKVENFDENKFIRDGQIIDDIENENFKSIKFMLKQKEVSGNKFNFKILKDRRTLQFNPKEKYKFQKIFSVINNNYIAEPWDKPKFFSFKLSTINSYFNEFNMTAISNNYFIIYFVQSLDKSTLKGDLYSLFQQLKNNEYLDKNIIIKISAITESNYINISENNIKNQINSIISSGTETIYGFLYEFIKSNRLNKKNIFRIYNFDYSYPQAIDMVTSINKYYAKKKRKKTGVYKKVIRNQGKPKKKLVDKNGNNNINNKNTNLANKKNNNNILNKNQIKKSVNIRNISLNNNQNNRPNANIRNNNRNEIKKALNITSLDNKSILKHSDSTHQSKQKEKNVRLNSKNNIKFVKFENEKNEPMTSKKNNSANKETTIKKNKMNSMVFNDLKTIKPEHTLIIHDINYEFVNNEEFKTVVKACGILNNNEK